MIFLRHILTEEDRAKGRRKVTNIKRLANSLRNRKKCAANCPIYEKCFLKKATTKCAVSELDSDGRSNLIKMLNSRTGIDDNLKEYAVRRRAIARREGKLDTLKGQDEQANADIRVGTYLFGTKKAIELKAETDNNVTLRWMTEDELNAKKKKQSKERKI